MVNNVEVARVLIECGAATNPEHQQGKTPLLMALQRHHSAVAELLRQAVFAQRVADPQVMVEITESPVEAPLLCDGAIVGQALANVLKNAGEAIAARTEASAPPGHICVRLTTPPGQLMIEIEDNGVGLPVKDRDRLTEPYVTTRAKGTGLGLAIVKRILEDHGGDLSIFDARQTPGARVTLTFPLTTSQAAIDGQGPKLEVHT